MAVCKNCTLPAKTLLSYIFASDQDSQIHRVYCNMLVPVFFMVETK